jgi:hypothetical protein
MCVSQQRNLSLAQAACPHAQRALAREYPLHARSHARQHNVEATKKDIFSTIAGRSLWFHDSAIALQSFLVLCVLHSMHYSAVNLSGGLRMAPCMAGRVQLPHGLAPEERAGVCGASRPHTAPEAVGRAAESERAIRQWRVGATECCVATIHLASDLESQ